jgi:hypothetical protein
MLFFSLLKNINSDVLDLMFTYITLRPGLVIFLSSYF